MVTWVEWSDEKFQRGKQLFIVDGLSASAAARVLNREFPHEKKTTRNAVVSKMSRSGIYKIGPTGQRNGSHGGLCTARTHKRKSRQRKGIVEKVAPLFSLEPLPPASEFDVARKTLQDLGPKECKWPVNEPGSENFGFCALDRVDGLPYCQHHSRRAFPYLEVKIRKVQSTAEPTADAGAVTREKEKV